MSYTTEPEITYSGGPLIRHPSFSHAEFSTHWLQNHAPIVIPYFLAGGSVLDYTQIHLPELHDRVGSDQSKEILKPFDGVALLTRKKDAVSKMDPKLSQEYYQRVILVDERKFLHESSGSSPVKREGAEGVEVPKLGPLEWRDLALEVGGTEHLLVKDGVCDGDIKDGAWEEWKKWEREFSK